MGSACCKTDSKSVNDEQLMTMTNSKKITKKSEQTQPIFRQKQLKDLNFILFSPPSKQNQLSPIQNLQKVMTELDLSPEVHDAPPQHNLRQQSKESSFPEDLATPGFIETANFQVGTFKRIDSLSRESESQFQNGGIQFIKEISDNNSDNSQIKKIASKSTKEIMGNSPVKIFVSSNSLVKKSQDLEKLRSISADGQMKNSQVIQRDQQNQSKQQNVSDYVIRHEEEVEDDSKNGRYQKSMSLYNKQRSSVQGMQEDECNTIKSNKSILKKQLTYTKNKRRNNNSSVKALRDPETNSVKSKRVKFNLSPQPASKSQPPKSKFKK